MLWYWLLSMMNNFLSDEYKNPKTLTYHHLKIIAYPLRYLTTTNKY